jgi:hypothetical protein
MAATAMRWAAIKWVQWTLDWTPMTHYFSTITYLDKLGAAES